MALLGGVYRSKLLFGIFQKSEHFLFAVSVFFHKTSYDGNALLGLLKLGRVEIEIFRKFSYFGGYIFKLKSYFRKPRRIFRYVLGKLRAFGKTFGGVFGKSRRTGKIFISRKGGKGCRHAPCYVFAVLHDLPSTLKLFKLARSYVGLLKLLYLKLKHINPALSFGKIRRHGS